MDDRIRPLAIEGYLYYRLHPKGRPFSVEDASTRNLGEPPAPSLAKYWEAKAGYSAFWNPHHLAQYMSDMGWEGQDGDEVLSFRGTPVGEGADGEPRVIPTGAGPEGRMGLEEFLCRLDATPLALDRWDNHTWGEGPGGRLADDGYRAIADVTGKTPEAGL